MEKYSSMYTSKSKFPTMKIKFKRSAGPSSAGLSLHLRQSKCADEGIPPPGVQRDLALFRRQLDVFIIYSVCVGDSKLKIVV